MSEIKLERQGILVTPIGDSFCVASADSCCGVNAADQASEKVAVTKQLVGLPRGSSLVGDEFCVDVPTGDCCGTPGTGGIRVTYQTYRVPAWAVKAVTCVTQATCPCDVPCKWEDVPETIYLTAARGYSYNAVDWNCPLPESELTYAGNDTTPFTGLGHHWLSAEWMTEPMPADSLASVPDGLASGDLWHAGDTFPARFVYQTCSGVLTQVYMHDRHGVLQWNTWNTIFLQYNYRTIPFFADCGFWPSGSVYSGVFGNGVPWCWSMTLSNLASPSFDPPDIRLLYSNVRLVITG